MRQSKTLRSLLVEAAHTLAQAGIDTPDNDARLLAAHLLEVAPLSVMFSDPYEGFVEEFSQLIARRAAREPLQHITGQAPFGPHTLAVGPGVFIPRPETEVIAEWGARLLADATSKPPTAIDLGTGSGAIALYLSEAVRGARVVGVEKQETALEYAKRNAPGVEFVQGDMTDPTLLRQLDGAVDVIVANPPYVPETPDLDPEVYHDPHEAVFSGADGMDAIRGLVPVAARLLKPGGHLGIEHDDTTSEAVQDVVRAHGAFGDVRAIADLTGRARFVVASKLPLCPPQPTIV
ncbi:peptide chain release factor N(5)-glutamine methyltransferase [Corynebacterium sp. HMSC29G08]|uniref:peptide chain release factor N(5)-glutamine methyltransferase n=1 Tax=Corynebacterium sp. HMSC29G08 TaxID=1581069 RepID=UPI000AF5CD00|nr:peptide chain release factor N(5)-glutamine methyltransferase [Corynebacterium sp. HMSC29G08]